MNRPQMWKYQLYCKITESYACPPSTKASVITVVDFKYSTGKMYCLLQRYEYTYARARGRGEGRVKR